MNSRFRRLIPSAEQIRRNRWLAWLGPRVHDPVLWHWSRHGVARGVALGVFFGLLVPLAQIPLSAAAAVALRANLPAAIASTLVTNPLTLGPIYYGAYRIGARVLGEKPAPPRGNAEDAAATPPEKAVGAWQRTLALGKPLFVGLALVAAAGGILAYGLIHSVWGLIARRRAGSDGAAPGRHPEGADRPEHDRQEKAG